MYIVSKLAKISYHQSLIWIMEFFYNNNMA